MTIRYITIITYIFALTLNLLQPSIMDTKKIKQNEIYALSAVLMDAENGRILFDKAGDEKRANASTTKILTCILALECGDLRDEVVFSSYASKMPQVKLGAKEGRRFYLEDLLYSLMLESHNDTAVAIAEHIGGDVKAFAVMMNEKARAIGCKNTYFITPNGLDKKDEINTHGTTARDLALIMRYCINISPKKDEYIRITETKEYRFSDLDQKEKYYCNNHNALLSMMDGAISGKTGFTGDAGYCYVGAVKREERIYIVALLGSGWPNNKGYKWKDVKLLINYGIDNYIKYFDINNEISEYIKENALGTKYVLEEDGSDGFVYIDVEKCEDFLYYDTDVIKFEYKTFSSVKMPVYDGEIIGYLCVYVNGDLYDVLSMKCKLE